MILFLKGYLKKFKDNIKFLKRKSFKNQIVIKIVLPQLSNG